MIVLLLQFLLVGIFSIQISDAVCLPNSIVQLCMASFNSELDCDADNMLIDDLKTCSLCDKPPVKIWHYQKYKKSCMDICFSLMDDDDASCSDDDGEDFEDRQLICNEGLKNMRWRTGGEEYKLAFEAEFAKWRKDWQTTHSANSLLSGNQHHGGVRGSSDVHFRSSLLLFFQ